RHRAAALSRVGRTRRWLFAGAAALSAGLAAGVSQAAPGHTLKARSTAVPSPEPRRVPPPSSRPASSGAAKSSAAQMPPLASAAELGLQGPSQPPQAAPSSQSAPPPTPAPAPAPAQ